MTHDEKLKAARAKFGRDFATDTGSTFKPKATRLLTEWSADQIQERRRKVVRPIDARSRRTA